MTEETRLREKVTRLLLDLGDDVATVAATLEGQGCRGARRDTQACPVQRYLARALGTPAHISVGPWDVLVRDGLALVVVELPKPVSAFVIGFDRHEFPALQEVA